jgi:Ca2+-binding RTX toxin-like protein
MLRKRNLTFESLEVRQVLSANPITLNGDVIHIRGTNHSDVINVERVTSGPNVDKVHVTLNNREAFFDYDYNGTGTGSISKVVIEGRRGSDQITIADNVYFPAEIAGGRGRDTITTGNGDDVVDGGRGNDTIFTWLGDDTVDGGKGNDWINCEDGNDRATGGSGNDMMWGGFQDDFLDGGKGGDSLVGEEGSDNIEGGLGNDHIEGQEGADIIHGGAGNDDISAGMNDDFVEGGLGNDTIDAGDENDFIDGGLGNDNILGGAGNDELKGGLGVDTLNGEAGNNLLDNEAEGDELLNGLVTDLDREFRIEFGTGGQSIAQLDVQNVNGQVVEKFTVEAHNLTGQSQFDFLVDGLPPAQVAIDGNGDGSVTYSSDPNGNELPFPLNAPPMGAGTAVGAASQLGGQVVQTFVI